jgi:hypothetical protein
MSSDMSTATIPSVGSSRLAVEAHSRSSAMRPMIRGTVLFVLCHFGGPQVDPCHGHVHSVGAVNQGE